MGISTSRIAPAAGSRRVRSAGWSRVWATGAFLSLPCLVGLVPVKSLAQRVPCQTVLHELHRIERRQNGRPANARRVAEMLGTKDTWVEKCASMYGRRLEMDFASAERRENQERRWEESEPEEVGREERATKGDVVMAPAPYRDKARQRGFTLGEQDWEPYQQRAWEPNAGRQWQPYIVDPHRSEPDDVPGLKRY